MYLAYILSPPGFANMCIFIFVYVETTCVRRRGGASQNRGVHTARARRGRARTQKDCGRTLTSLMPQTKLGFGARAVHTLGTAPQAIAALVVFHQQM